MYQYFFQEKIQKRGTRTLFELRKRLPSGLSSIQGLVDRIEKLLKKGEWEISLRGDIQKRGSKIKGGIRSAKR